MSALVTQDAPHPFTKCAKGWATRSCDTASKKQILFEDDNKKSKNKGIRKQQ